MPGVGAKAISQRLAGIVGAQAAVQNAAREAAAAIVAERQPPDDGDESDEDEPRDVQNPG